MTTSQASSIKSYTESGYRMINRSLLKGVTTQEAEELAEAISTLPSFSGVSFRSIHIDEIGFYLNSLKANSEITFAAFSSTSQSEKVAAAFGNVLFTIQGKTGKDISAYSDAPAEKEILFTAGTTFVVKAVKAIKIAGRVYGLQVKLSEK